EPSISWRGAHSKRDCDYPVIVEIRPRLSREVSARPQGSRRKREFCSHASSERSDATSAEVRRRRGMSSIDLRLSLTFVVVLGGAVPAGGGKGGRANGKAACLSCAMSACPTQAAACDASPGCKALRACSLACRTGDLGCQNACTTAVASDSTAITAGANYLSCAQVACPSQCSGSSATGTAGTSGGTAGTAGSRGPGGPGAAGGATRAGRNGGAGG